MQTRLKSVIRKPSSYSWLKPFAALPYNGGIPLYGNAMNSKIGQILLTLALACGVSACGQKGDLYMPENGRSAENAPTFESEVSEEDAESSDASQSTKEQKK